jgi:hypothetical protein
LFVHANSKCAQPCRLCTAPRSSSRRSHVSARDRCACLEQPGGGECRPLGPCRVPAGVRHGQHAGGGLPTSQALGSVLHGVHRFFDFYGVSTCGGLRRLCSPGSRRCYPGCPGALHGSTVHCTTERSASLRSELVEWLFSGIIANGVVQELGVSFFGMVKNSFGAPVVFFILLPRRLILFFFLQPDKRFCLARLAM